MATGENGQHGARVQRHVVMVCQHGAALATIRYPKMAEIHASEQLQILLYVRPNFASWGPVIANLKQGFAHGQMKLVLIS